MWNPIETAPRDGTDIIVVTGKGYAVRARWAEVEDGWDAWQAREGYPPCWHDGICWTSKADEHLSDHPVWWAPAPVSLTP